MSLLGPRAPLDGVLSCAGRMRWNAGNGKVDEYDGHAARIFSP